MDQGERGTDVGIRERGASKEVERGGEESLIPERGKIRFCFIKILKLSAFVLSYVFLFSLAYGLLRAFVAVFSSWLKLMIQKCSEVN